MTKQRHKWYFNAHDSCYNFPGDVFYIKLWKHIFFFSYEIELGRKQIYVSISLTRYWNIDPWRKKKKFFFW